jgi:branched-chain amino acid transport system substrate-binding protein
MFPALEAIAPGGPDVLYLPIFEPAGPRLVHEVRSVPGLEETLLIGADGLLADSFPENAGENAVGMFLTGPYVSGPSYVDFLARWAQEIGGVPPSGFHAHAYDATNLLLDAIEKVAVAFADGGLQIGRSALRDALTATENYPGLLGCLTCTEYGDCGTLEALAIFQITEAEIFGGEWPPAVFFSLSP